MGHAMDTELMENVTLIQKPTRKGENMKEERQRRSLGKWKNEMLVGELGLGLGLRIGRGLGFGLE